MHEGLSQNFDPPINLNLVRREQSHDEKPAFPE